MGCIVINNELTDQLLARDTLIELMGKQLLGYEKLSWNLEQQVAVTETKFQNERKKKRRQRIQTGVIGLLLGFFLGIGA